MNLQIDLFFFLGDFFGRRIFYKIRVLPAPIFLIFSVVGAACGLCKIPLITLLCAFFVAFANGSLYAQTCKHIDDKVDKQFNLISLSFWLFIGDIGSVLSSNLIQYLDEII